MYEIPNFNPVSNNSLIGPTVLPNVVYYNDDHSNSPVCTVELSQINGSTWTLPSTWQELTKEIEHGEDKIVFHIDMICRAGSSIKEFIDSMNTIARFMIGHKPLKIVVLIKPTTTQQQIQELKEAKILGIGYDINYYPFERAAEATAALIAGVPYWPEDIISQLPNAKQLPRSIYFRYDVDVYITKDMAEELKKNAQFQVCRCTDWDELSSALRSDAHQLVFHISMLTRLDLTISEIIESLKTKMKLFEVDIPISVGIEPNTPISVIKDLKRAGVFGLVPSAAHWGAKETVTALNALVNRESYWPRHILDQLPGNVPKKTSAIKTGINVSPRQQQVLDLIKNRGMGNKQIANALSISENTVKMHVSDIMRAYGVKSRVQLAVLA